MTTRTHHAKDWQIRAALDGRLAALVVPLGKLRGRFGAIRQFGPSDTAGYDWHFRDKEGLWHDLRHAKLLRALPLSPGDLLVVKEAWARADDPKWLVSYRADGRCGAWGWDGDGKPVFNPHGYVLDRKRRDHLGKYGLLPRYGGRWRSPAIMPREFSRMTWSVEDVRVCRLHEYAVQIGDTEADELGLPYCAKCGGAGWINSGPDGGWQCTASGCGDAYADAFRTRWTADHGPDSWALNPWVAVNRIAVHLCNIESMETADAD